MPNFIKGRTHTIISDALIIEGTLESNPHQKRPEHCSGRVTGGNHFPDARPVHTSKPAKSDSVNYQFRGYAATHPFPRKSSLIWHRQNRAQQHEAFQPQYRRIQTFSPAKTL